MQEFCFEAVPSITVKWGGAQKLGEFVERYYEERKVLIVTDASLHKTGILEQPKLSLELAGFKVAVFDKVVADPPENIVLECVEKAKAAGVNIVIGIGGGSSLDVAKLAAVLIRSEQKLQDIYGIGKVKGTRLPLIQIPTTAGTGSEATNITIVTTGETTKMGVVADQLYADKVLLDGELTIGLPKLQTATTGIDAMVHAIEAYTGKLKKNPLSDAFAREALRLLSANIVTACNDGHNKEAREAMLLGANLAGQAFANSPVGAVHALAYPLGGHYHLPHGLTNALMLGPVLRFNMKAAAHLYAELGEVVGTHTKGTELERSKAFIEFMEKLMRETGAPRHLKEVGVTDNSLALLASDAMKQTRSLVNNPVDVTEADALELYRQAF